MSLEEEFQCLLDYKSLSATSTKYCIFDPYGTVGVVGLLYFVVILQGWLRQHKKVCPSTRPSGLLSTPHVNVTSLTANNFIFLISDPLTGPIQRPSHIQEINYILLNAEL